MYTTFDWGYSNEETNVDDTQEKEDLGNEKRFVDDTPS
jgi:hypothetical protein